MKNDFGFDQWVEDLNILCRDISRREAQVIVLLRCGWSIEEIAEELDIPTGTVDLHREQALQEIRRAKLIWYRFLAPEEFWADPDAYPEMKEHIDELLSFTDGTKEFTVTRTGRR